MSRENLPYRTAKTWLTDDDLILMDVMFSGRVRFQSLRSNNFRPQWNLPYSHSYGDEELKTRLTSLVERGILATSQFLDQEVYGFTPKGGRFWSTERSPDWEKYCTDSHIEERANRSRVTVLAISRAVRDDFLLSWPPSKARTKKKTLKDYELIYWKSFPEIYAGVAYYDEQKEWNPREYLEMLRDENNHWSYVESVRTWWRFVPELQRFVPTT